MNPIQANNRITPLPSDTPRSKNAPAKGPANTTAGGATQEQVTLSPAAQALLHASSNTKESGHLEALRAAIGNGSFTILPAKIGQGLVQDQTQLLPGKPNSQQS